MDVQALGDDVPDDHARVQEAWGSWKIICILRFRSLASSPSVLWTSFPSKSTLPPEGS